MMVKVLLELVRIILVFLILGMILRAALGKLILMVLGINVDHTNGGWLLGWATLILIFVFYRNKLQLAGFFQGKETMKLSKKGSLLLITCSVILIGIAPFLH